MDAYLEFINENSQRAYPFIENSVPFSSINNFQLPQDVIADFTGYSLIPIQTVKLLSYHNSIFTFRIQSNTTVFIDVPILCSDFTIGAKHHGYTALPGDSSVIGAYIAITIGGGNISVNTVCNFNDTAPIERGLMFDISGSQINLLEIIRKDHPDYLVHNDIKITGGFNVNVVQSNKTISIGSKVGGGMLGKYEGYNDPDEMPVGDDPASSTNSICSSLKAVESISGIKPDADGLFLLIGGNGVTVKNYPLDSRIEIIANIPNPTQLGCILVGTPRTHS